MIRIFHNKKVARMTWIVLLVIIGPAFIFWGIGSYQRSAGGREDENFGKIFGRRVSRQEYIDALKAVQMQMRMQFGESYNEIQKMVNFKAITLERLALTAEARRRGLRVSDKELIDYIEHVPSFQRNGVFDKAAYGMIIEYNLRMPARSFEEQIRNNLMIQKLSDQTAGKVSVTDAEIREAYRKDHEQLNLDYISAIPADFAGAVTIPDAQAKDFFTHNSLDFKQPLSFNLAYVSTDKEPQVTAINARLEKEPLEKIAADMGLAIKETGLFTQSEAIPGIGWSRELSAKLESAAMGQVFAPLEMEKKYYILKLKERKEPYIPEFEAVKDKVKAKLVKERSRQAAKDKITAFLTTLSQDAAKQKPEGIEKLSAAAGLKTGTTGMFKSGSYLEGIGASDSIYTAGSGLKEGQLSDVIEIPSGFYIVKVKAKETIDEQKLSQEKEAVKEKLVEQKKSEIFGKFAEDLMKKALQ
jgi:peptidyl-prolyl cis-trans isomerase D